MRIYLKILYVFMIIFSFAFCTIEPNLVVDDANNEDMYNKALDYRLAGNLEECLKVLFQIKCCYLKANYSIAEIYLNDYKNYNISLDYFNEIISFIDDGLLIDDSNSDVYKKSLFMTSYIYSNYLGMYSKGYDGYMSFLDKFPNDE